MVIQIGKLRAEVEHRNAHVARLCASSANLVAKARQHIEESQKLFLKLSDTEERKPG